MELNAPIGDCKALAGIDDVCCSMLMWAVFGTTGILLILSLSCNVFCCARNYRKDPNTRFLPGLRRSFKSEEVEDNPVYGNINYIYTGMEPRSDGQEHRTGPKPLTPGQPCYARLELPSSRGQRARRPTPTPYSETLPMLKCSRAEGVAKQHRLRVTPGEGSLSKTLAPSLGSGQLENTELYSSVQVGNQGAQKHRDHYANKETLKF